MVDNVPDLLWAKDIEDRYLFVNQAICDKLLMNSSTDTPLGKNDLFFAERERQRGHRHTFGEICVNSDTEVKEAGMPRRFLEDGLVRGEYLVLDVHKAPFFNGSGEMIGTVGCGRDVTREKQTDKALRDSEKRFRELIEDVSAISIQGYDEERRVIFWNHASEKLYGYTELEALGRKLEDLIIPDAMRHDVKMLHHRWVAYGEKIPAGPLCLKNKKGRDVHVFSSHVMHATQHGKEMFCIDVDLSPIRQMEKEKEKLQVQLQQAQKMESIGTLAGGIAHDFNNILFPILGYTEILLEDVPGDSPFRKSLHKIHAGALRASDLVKQILTFSRQENHTQKPMKPQPVVKEALKLIRSTIPTTIDIKQDIRNDCGIIHADPTQIHQIVMNLTTNAYHAMDGGVITVSLREVELGEPDTVPMDVNPGVYACLTVADTGSGMPKEVEEQIFFPFFTTKETGKGTGMGLAVVHGIVKSMNGGIRVNSEVGRGTDIHIYLPVVKKGSEKQPAKPKRAVKMGSEHILLVDDEEAIISMEKEMLTRLGYQVTSRTSSIEALEAFRSAPDRFDLVITDMAMPNMSGDKLSAALIGIRPDIQVLLCTGFSEELSGETTKELGIKGIIMKPIVMKDLSWKIREVLDHRGG
jgi:PAS domain S-box-containing protein